MLSDSMKKSIGEWLDELRYQSDGLMEYLCASELDDSSGWGEILRTYIGDSVEKLRRKRGILLTGGKGCGKHTAAYHVAVKLSGLGFGVIFADGEDFAVFSAESGGIYESLNDLLDSYADRDLCLVLEFPEKCKCSEELMKRLGQFACMYAVHDDLPRFFPVVITENEEHIPSMLRERLCLFRLLKPDYRQRMNFLTNNISAFSPLFAVLTGGSPSFGDIADAAEGLNYGQLRDAVNYAEMYIETKLTDNYSDLPDRIREQFPPETPNDVRMSFMHRIEDFIGYLPELMKKLPAVRYDEDADRNKSESIDDEAADRGRFSSVTKEDVNKMTGRELAVDVFGRERAEQLDRLVEELP